LIEKVEQQKKNEDCRHRRQQWSAQIYSFVRSFVDIYILTVSTTKATTVKFEEIKEKEKTESEKL
jgi:hypothetical protein